MSPRPVVLATNAIHPRGHALLAAHAEVVVAPEASAETLRALARDADGILVRAQLPDDICEHAPRLKAIVRHGVGLDFIPVEQATRHGVAVANLPGSNSQAVAEYCIAQMLNLRRPLARTDAAVRAEGWEPARERASAFGELGGSTLGILGVGAIGSRLAALAGAFGMQVLGTSRRTGQPRPGIEEVTLDALFERSHAIVLACALTPQTRGLVDARRIASMRRDAVLINVSRGAVIDTAALADALERGRIAGAALDVYDRHPLPADDRLLRCPNLLLSPHVAGITATTYAAMSEAAAASMLALLAGGEPASLVNPDYRRFRDGCSPGPTPLTP